jgi:hypothetical protein
MAVVVHPGAQLAAQPGVKERLLQARVEVRLPAQGASSSGSSRRSHTVTAGYSAMA